MQTLYLIVRKDLPDNKVGKMMAQIAHAQSDFDKFVSNLCPNQHVEILTEINHWKENRSFGTTIVLHETLKTMEKIVKNTSYSGLTTDESYPYSTICGDVFTMNVVTAAWIFTSKLLTDFDYHVMKDFKLHP
jgi:peptidyl-tRNA hydrolase